MLVSLFQVFLNDLGGLDSQIILDNLYVFDSIWDILALIQECQLEDALTGQLLILDALSLKYSFNYVMVPFQVSDLRIYGRNFKLEYEVPSDSVHQLH